MKKFLTIIILMLGFFSIAYAYNFDEMNFNEMNLEKAMADLCKLQKDMTVKNASKIENCISTGVDIDKNNVFIVRGIKNGQCYYAKAKVDNMIHGHTVSDCYAPLSVMKSLADAYKQYAQSPCSEFGVESEQKRLIDEKIKSLEAYCTPTTEPFYF